MRNLSHPIVTSKFMNRGMQQLTNVNGNSQDIAHSQFTYNGHCPRSYKSTLLLCALALMMTKIALFATTAPTMAEEEPMQARVMTGADILAETDFFPIAGKRVGLVTNHTGLINGEHLADTLHKTQNVELVAILAPEHGFRGVVEAGDKVKDGVDTKTGVPIFSLYGKTKKPTKRMLRNVDVLIFDIQDIGARFYTYISTMGLAMQAAAEAKIPFIVLDRPNPLGGNYISGFVLEPARRSFVGQYPIPIVHGLTVGELAHMIKGEKYLKGLQNLDLSVIKMRGWKRAMRWPQTGRTWVATSPNIPSFDCALVYPGIGIIGETNLVNEGRGTPAPFTVFGAPWLNAKKMAKHLNALTLPGVKFEATRYTPRSIPSIATNPKYVGKKINGVRVVVTDVARFEPLETGIHALSLVIKQARANGISKLFRNKAMFYAISGTKRLHRKLLKGASGTAIIDSWNDELAKFGERRQKYFLY